MEGRNVPQIGMLVPLKILMGKKILKPMRDLERVDQVLQELRPTSVLKDWTVPLFSDERKFSEQF